MDSNILDLLVDLSHPGNGDTRFIDSSEITEEQLELLDEYLDEIVTPAMADYSYYPLTREAVEAVNDYFSDDSEPEDNRSIEQIYPPERF